MKLFRLAYKNIIYKKTRFILTTLVIVFGVMFVSGTFIFTDGLRDFFNNVSNELAGNSEITVRSQINSEERRYAPTIPVSLSDSIESVSGVQRVDISITDSDVILESEKDESLDADGGNQSLGLNWDDNIAKNLELAKAYGDGSSRRPRTGTEFAINLRAATKHKMTLGDTFKISTFSNLVRDEFTLVGVFVLGGEQNNDSFSPQLIALETNRAIELFNNGEGVDAYEVYVKPGSNIEKVTADIEATLSNSSEVKKSLGSTRVEVVQTSEVGEELRTQFNSFITIFRNILLGFAAIILLVSAFVIFNIFSIILDQRIKELGLLRAVGLGGGQLLRLVLGEAFIIGFISTIIGIAAGRGVAYLLTVILKAASGDTFPNITQAITLRTVWVAAVVGIGLTMLAALPVAISSKRVSPIAALREGVSAVRQTEVEHKRLRAIAGLGVGVAAAVAALFLTWLWVLLLSLVAVSILFWGGVRFGNWVGQFLVLGLGTLWLIFAAVLSVGTGEALVLFALGVVFVFVGVNLVSPLFGSGITRVLGAPFKMIYRSVGNLGVENSARNPKRAATTSATLMIGIALLSMVAIMASSLRASFADTLDDAVKSDLVICEKNCTIQSSSFPAEQAGEINSVNGISSALFVGGFREELKIVSSTTNGQIRTYNDGIRAGEIELPRVKDHFNLKLNTNPSVVSPSAPNAVFIHRGRADKYNVEIGSTLGVALANGQSPTLQVAGIFETDLTDLLGGIIINPNTLALGTERPRQIFAISIIITPGVDQSLVEKEIMNTRVGNLLNNAGILTQTKKEFNNNQTQGLNAILIVVSIFLGLSFVVAFLGIIMTLLLSVFERTREIGLLRAIGMRRLQVRRMIRIEAIIIGFLGSLMGVVLGVIFGFVSSKVLPPSFISVFSINWTLIILYAILGAVVGVASSIIPAVWASRTNILRAIAEH